jgi:hypothetical protein
VVAGSFWATVGLFASAAPEVEESKRRAFTVRDHGGEASTTSVTAAQDLIRGTAYNTTVVPGVENTTMQQLQLVSSVLAMAALVVCGCIFTRKPRKILPMDTLRPAVPDEHQPSCFALEEERGGNWTGSGVPVIKEARPTL